MIPTIDTLALEFSRGLHAYLTPEQMEEVVERNSSETSPGICHSHDFCDANMFLHEVFMKFGMDVADEGGMEKYGYLWDQAWNLAKSHGFQLTY